MKMRTPGRPIEKPLPAPIPDARRMWRALVTTPPKAEGDWDYLKDREVEVAGSLLRRSPKDK